jgi:putative ABC transport system substrate-binding protein
MRRREFITLLGGAAAAWPLAARAQRLPVVGLLSSRSPATDAPLIAIIRQGLNEMGFVEGQNVAIDYRWAEGQYDRLPGLAADLVRRQVAVVVTIGGDPSALAAKAAIATIPIVCIVSDPVRSGLVNNLHRPGGNLTGASPFLDDLGPKRLELVRELRPKAAMIAILVNPHLPTAEKELADIQAAARGVGQKIEILNASTNRDIEAAFARLAQTRADALLVTTDPLFHARAAQFVVLSARYVIPTVYFRREFAVAGGLMSYGSNAEEAYRVLGSTPAAFSKARSPAIYRSSGRPSSNSLSTSARPRHSASTCRPRCSPAPTR